MATRRDIGNTAPALLEPDVGLAIGADSFYARARAGRREQGKPSHYKVICISMYLETLAKLDEMVKELKRRGYTKANRSALLRHALDLVDLEAVPRGL